ncbi:Serine/threonine-protein phosphatase 2A activator [Holothuria leucospilota]|uniref:Serine/threonine-protein phosphatase 2A activator n=1 Tax=Holothuria leucospilota TaxID=206669 RepID=A0A9Q1C5Z9_HOLLE|nr:Serine/threonine-protein phosphatase 2A activator [Holothuria leucospilota]
MAEPIFQEPTKQVKGVGDLAKWKKSQAYSDYMGFVRMMNNAVKSKTLTDSCNISETCHKLIKMIDIIDEWAKEIPPLEQPQRFGNMAFRTWHTKLKEGSIDIVLNLSSRLMSLAAHESMSMACACRHYINLKVYVAFPSHIDCAPKVMSPLQYLPNATSYRDCFNYQLEMNAETLIKDVLPDSCKDASLELKAYVTEGFGNYTRIDYGTGHEMNYAAFLCCLFKLRVLTEADSVAVVHHVFNRYLKFMRYLQMRYRMEPAGSQGVWGLDDFQFLPYIWGSSQLLAHEKLSPKDFVNSDVKTGPFAEHSNQLWNISGVPHWTKVNSGLIKMYDNEVLGKFPVVQHFHFGNLMSIKPA